VTIGTSWPNGPAEITTGKQIPERQEAGDDEDQH
jgi:hypothetical protein